MPSQLTHPLILATGLTLAAGSSLFAQADAADDGSALAATRPESAEIIELAPFTVIGSKENLERLPGSGAYIDVSDIATFSYDDINQIIRRVPGVYVRQEDGYGLFPNISLRGVSTTRNSKITVMEDGILMAPAPYSDPAAYYTPNAGRMSGLEVLKGSSQIKYGPETTGGVLNYLSTPIPDQTGGFLRASYGTDNDIRLHAGYGLRTGNDLVDVGLLVENAYRETDGFKKIDSTPGGGYAGSDQTGFTRNEPMVKLRFDFKTAAPQSLELKYGRTDLDADETYLGLTEADFAANPYRRYAASRFDNITTEQERYSARYTIRPTDRLELAVTAYKTDFARNWYKLDAAGVGLAGAFRNLSEVLAGEHGQGAIDVLKGEAEGRLRVRANNRVYGAEGIELQTSYTFSTGDIDHRVQAGVRFHSDFADRRQWDDIYTQAADGSVVLTTPGTPGTQENRRAESDAVALFIQDEISIGRLTITPGVRYEMIDYTDIRRSTAIPTLGQVTSRSTGDIDYVAPGLGLTWTQSDKLTWIAGVHRGISPPGPSAAAAGSTLTEEKSLGFEAGLRYNNRRDFSMELIAFHTAFEDLIVESNAGGGGGAGVTSNIGEVNTSGLELALAYDPSITRGWAVRNPWNASLTYTRARLGNDVNSTGNGGAIAESIFSGGRKGNELPYIPEFQISVGTGLEFGRLGVFLDAYYQPEVYASANNSSAQVNPDASAAPGLQPAADSRYGVVKAYALFDASLRYRLSDNATFKLAVTNLLDREYMVSRVPIGPRPGAPRTISAGIDLTF